MEITIDADAKPIIDIIRELKSGKYFLPSFQREWVWNEDKIKELIESILKGYPIGVIIRWKPSRWVDPFSKPLIGQSNETSERYYVIDGQQRLTSLLLMFSNWKIKRGNEEISVKLISYIPTTDKLVKGYRGIDISKILRAFALDENIFDRSAYSELTKEYTGYMDKLTKLARKIQSYKVPIYTITTLNEDERTPIEMAEAFVRVNRYGVRIGSVELMLSYIGGEIGGAFVSRIRDLHDWLESQVNLKIEPLLRFLFSNFGLKQTQISKSDKFKGNVRLVKSKLDQMQEIFENSKIALCVLLEFLKRLGIKDVNRLLPSQTALIPIMKYFYVNKISNLNNLSSREIESIENWFILVNFYGYYSTSPDTKLDKDLELIEGSIGRFPFEDLKRNMRGRRVKTNIEYRDIERGLQTNVKLKAGRNYLFLLYVLLVKNNADDWTGKSIRECDIRNLEEHHIFPKSYLKENIEFETDEDEEIKINCLGNITFISKDINIEIGDKSPKEYLSQYIIPARRHFIPDDESLWDVDNYEKFLERRIKLIYDAGKRFFRDIFI